MSVDTAPVVCLADVVPVGVGGGPRGDTALLCAADAATHGFPVPLGALRRHSPHFAPMLPPTDDGTEGADTRDACATAPTTFVVPCGDVRSVQLLATWLRHYGDSDATAPPAPLPSVYECPHMSGLLAPDDAWARAFFGTSVLSEWEFGRLGGGKGGDSGAGRLLRLQRAAVCLGVTSLSQTCAALLAHGLRDAAAAAPNPVGAVRALRPAPGDAAAAAADGATLDPTLLWLRAALSDEAPPIEPEAC